MSEVTVRPIRDDIDLQKAIERLSVLFGSAPGTPEADECEVLMTLVESYENKHYPDPELDPIDLIRQRMLDLGLRNKDLIPALGSDTSVSLVLNRRRRLTVPMIRNLSSLLRVPAGALLGPSEAKAS